MQQDPRMETCHPTPVDLCVGGAERGKSYYLSEVVECGGRRSIREGVRRVRTQQIARRPPRRNILA